MKITITTTVSEEQLRRIRAVSGDLDVVVARTPEEQDAHLPDTDVVLGRFTPEILQKAVQLKWVQTPIAGADFVLFDQFLRSPIPLVTAKGIVGTHLAEHAFALILALTRGVGTAMRQRRWDIRPTLRVALWELSGKTLGIVGLGGTGIEVAKRAQAFGMEVIATRRTQASAPSFVRQVWPPDRFNDLLDQSDIVVICAPLTRLTRGMFNLEAFQRMRPHALLVNVSRGEIVNEPSLLQALRQGLIGGAGLDVFATEPLPEDSPLWSMENVIVTPHVAGESSLRSDRVVDLFVTNLQRYAGGQPLLNIVDKQEGY